MGYASAWAAIPDTIQKKVDAYPMGMLSRWCPQHIILSHEVHEGQYLCCDCQADCVLCLQVTGWFLTHGGHNSVIEAIGQGVPM